nr:hypothetical protein [Kitasatospora sp. MMS16-BH015]
MPGTPATPPISATSEAPLPTPLPGDFAVVRMSGSAGRLIRVGQWLNGDGFSDFEHAFVYVGDGELVEGEPGGASTGSLAGYEGRPMLWSTGRIPLDDEQREAVVAAARGYLGTPYSVMDYFALATHHLHLPVSPLFKGYVMSSKHMICSQLVDQCYHDAGVQLFDDHRWPGYVTPGDLTRLLRH